MIIETTFIKDLLLLTPRVYRDERGYFMESYNRKKISKMIKCDFVQDNESLSKKNVLRGLHLQKPPYAQSKLIRVIRGSILDHIKGSQTTMSANDLIPSRSENRLCHRQNSQIIVHHQNSASRAR